MTSDASQSSASNRRVPIFPGSLSDFAAPLSVDKSAETAALAQLAQQVMDDPVKMQQLCDRILDLLSEDLRQQQERSRFGR